MVKTDDLEMYYWDFEQEVKEKDKKKSLESLVKELEKENKPKEDEETDYERLEEIKNAIAQKLGLLSPIQTGEWVRAILDNIADELVDIRTDLKNHRHETTKTYSSKAEI